MTAYQKRRPIIVDEDKTYFVGEGLPAEVTIGVQNQMNYLRNWYYPQLAYYTGPHDTDINPIGGTFYIQTCYPSDNQPIMMAFKPGSYSDSGSPSWSWYRDWSSTAFAGTPQTWSGVEDAPFVYTGDQQLNRAIPLEAILRGPSTGDGTISVGCFLYSYMSCSAMTMAKSPQKWLTNLQAKVVASQVGKADFIKGYNGSETSNSVGEMIYWCGDKSQGNDVDTAENATRRSAQWIHPAGLWGDDTDYSSSTCIWGDTEAPTKSGATLDFYPRNLYGETAQYAKIGVVYTTTGGLFVSVKNLATGITFPSAMIGTTSGAAALLTFDNMVIDPTQVNPFAVSCELAEGNEFVIHSVAVFETDD